MSKLVPFYNCRLKVNYLRMYFCKSLSDNNWLIHDPRPVEAYYYLQTSRVFKNSRKLLWFPFPLMASGNPLWLVGSGKKSRKINELENFYHFLLDSSVYLCSSTAKIKWVRRTMLLRPNTINQRARKLLFFNFLNYKKCMLHLFCCPLVDIFCFGGYIQYTYLDQ